MKVESVTSDYKNDSLKSQYENLELSTFNLQLKIGFDGKRAANNLTGLGNYSRSLIENLAEQFPNNQYLVYSPKLKPAKQIELFFRNKNIKLKLPSTRSFLWRSFGILKDLDKDEVKIYHGLSHEIPFGINHTKIKSVVTIHDLIFLRFPKYYKFIDRKLYEWKSKVACNHADKIIAISQKTKDDIIALYRINPEKIEVIYQSCDNSFKLPFSEQALNSIRLTYKLPEKYILNVGTIEERKNLKLIIQGLKNINVDHKLVVIGKQTAYFKTVKKEIHQLGLIDRVIFLQNIPFADLPAVYQMASVFIYPSFYEGFGIPIIEALYSNVPVVAATGSCLEEAGGPNSIYISPTNPLELAKAVNQILDSTLLQAKMKKKGYEFVQKFNSPKVTQQLMHSYLNVLK